MTVIDLLAISEYQRFFYGISVLHQQVTEGERERRKYRAHKQSVFARQSGFVLKFYSEDFKHKAVVR